MGLALASGNQISRKEHRFGRVVKQWNCLVQDLSISFSPLVPQGREKRDRGGDGKEGGKGKKEGKVIGREKRKSGQGEGKSTCQCPQGLLTCNAKEARALWVEIGPWSFLVGT